MTGRAGQAENRQKITGRKEQAEKNRQKRTGRKG
jgi:hypothetical protein